MKKVEDRLLLLLIAIAIMGGIMGGMLCGFLMRIITILAEIRDLLKAYE